MDLRQILERAGARAWLISTHAGTIRGWTGDDLGEPIRVDRTIGEARPEDFAGLVLAGAVLNQDALRRSEEAGRFVRAIFDAGKPVAAMSQGLVSVLDTGLVRDRTVTSFPSVRQDLIDAGADWVDAAVVVDHGLVTSRCAADIDEFGARVIDALVSPPGRHRAADERR